jgi:hypothetical protein
MVSVERLTPVSKLIHLTEAESKGIDLSVLDACKENTEWHKMTAVSDEPAINSAGVFAYTAGGNKK